MKHFSKILIVMALVTACSSPKEQYREEKQEAKQEYEEQLEESKKDYKEEQREEKADRAEDMIDESEDIKLNEDEGEILVE